MDQESRSCLHPSRRRRSRPSRRSRRRMSSRTRSHSSGCSRCIPRWTHNHRCFDTVLGRLARSHHSSHRAQGKRGRTSTHRTLGRRTLPRSYPCLRPYPLRPPCLGSAFLRHRPFPRSHRGLPRPRRVEGTPLHRRPARPDRALPRRTGIRRFHCPDILHHRRHFPRSRSRGQWTPQRHQRVCSTSQRCYRTMLCLASNQSIW